MNTGLSGLAVELAIEDRSLANRIATVLQDLNVALVEAGSGDVSIVLTDILPESKTDQLMILLADELEVSRGFCAGIMGVLPKSVGTTELRIALEAASHGLAVAPLSMLEETLGHRPIAELADPVEVMRFTPREMEVLALLAEGASNQMIANKLGISIHTAKFHVASILEKLDATGRTDAVAHAVRLGLLML